MINFKAFDVVTPWANKNSETTCIQQYHSFFYENNNNIPLKHSTVQSTISTFCQDTDQLLQQNNVKYCVINAYNQLYLLPWYNWNIVESGIKHH